MANLGSAERLEWEGWYSNINPSLTYLDGETFLLIKDKRYADRREEFRLTGVSREIYLYYNEIQTFVNIHKYLRGKTSKTALQYELNALCRNGLMFREDDQCLSLAIPA